MTKGTTHFGFKEVPTDEKQSRVREVFSSVASRYDLMNDVMSLGLHRLWKRQAVAMCRLRKGQTVLDVAGGTGDITALMLPKVGKAGQVFLSDINAAMLSEGLSRLIDQGLIGQVAPVQANAESLPFPDGSFDHVTIAFGLRNVTHKELALKDFYRVLKPGGRLMILEFSKPTSRLIKPWYDLYSFEVLPRWGSFIAGDRESYQYLVESIRKHPCQETLKSMLAEAGFEHCNYHNMTGGIVAIHRGIKAL